MLKTFKEILILTTLGLFTLIPISCIEEPEDAPPAPEADFEALATTILVGTSVEFTDLSKGSPDTWSWTFSGGTPGASDEQNPTVVYNTPGQYEVSLTASNVTGDDTESKSGYITVLAELEADFEADKTEINEGEVITFTDLTSGATSWSWTFEGGDPSTSTEQNPTVAYMEAGVYEVTLEASNDLSSDTETKTSFITVIDPYPTLTSEAAIVESLEIAEYDLQSFLRFAFTFDGVLTNQVTLDQTWANIASQSFVSVDAKIYQFWDLAYELIYLANNIIISSNNVITDEAAKQSYIAQAKVIRAIIYLELVDYFGGVPIETTQIPGDDLTRGEKTAVVSWVISDLDEAEGVLPSTANNELGFTVDLARGFLIRAYLMNEDWQNVSSLSSQIIDGGTYSLEADISNIYNENSTESLYSFIVSGNADFDLYFDLGSYVPLFKLTEAYLAHAEANFNLGDNNTAKNSLNMVRPRRAQAEHTVISADDILDQWEIELDMEGQFFGTLKRFGKVEEVLMVESFKTILPIPQAIIDEHPNMFQNPGY